LSRRRQAEIDSLLAEGRERIGALSDRDLLIAGAALYAGEGSKRDGTVCFANSDPRMIRLFCLWLRRFFAPEEPRLRVKLYLHEGLDRERAIAFWAKVSGIPPDQFGKPYRAVADPTIRNTKHPMGCASVVYQSARLHRQIMGLVHALLTCEVSIPG
jgi:hypothetical protein